MLFTIIARLLMFGHERHQDLSEMPLQYINYKSLSAHTQLCQYRTSEPRLGLCHLREGHTDGKGVTLHDRFYGTAVVKGLCFYEVLAARMT